EIGHDQIKHDAVYSRFCSIRQHGDRRIAAAYDHRFIAKAIDHVFDEPSLDRIVVDDQDAFSHCVSHSRHTSGADLTFATHVPRVREANVESKAPLALMICWWSFDSNIRKRACRNGMRMLESGHQCAELGHSRRLALTGCYQNRIEKSA